MAHHTADRFTDDDRAIAGRAMEHIAQRWRTAATRAPHLDGLVRVGAHAIGCSIHDLRDSEVEWLEATARTLLGLDAVTDR